MDQITSDTTVWTDVKVTLTVNGRPQRLCLDAWVTLVDAVRDELDLTGTPLNMGEVS